MWLWCDYPVLTRHSHTLTSGQARSKFSLSGYFVCKQSIWYRKVPSSTVRYLTFKVAFETWFPNC